VNHSLKIWLFPASGPFGPPMRTVVQHSASLRGRHVLGWFLCLLHVMIALGITIPIPMRVVKDRSQPFPCMDKACGCIDADHCWQSCQCSTARERVAWAKSHGIRYPKYLAAAAASEAKQQSTKHTCCQLRIDERKSCCQAKDASHPEQENSEDGSSLILLQALACRGKSVVGLAIVGDLMVPPVRVAWHRAPPPCAVVALIDVEFSSVVTAPEVPPPRRPLG
jgi:hypothetical protein